MKTSAENFLNTQGIDLKTTALNCVIEGYMRTPSLCSLLETFANVRIEEERTGNEQKTFTVEVKNISTDLQSLENLFSEIAETYELHKDTFIFHNVDEAFYNSLMNIGEVAAKAGKSILVSKIT